MEPGPGATCCHLQKAAGQGSSFSGWVSALTALRTDTEGRRLGIALSQPRWPLALFEGAPVFQNLYGFDLLSLAPPASGVTPGVWCRTVSRAASEARRSGSGPKEPDRYSVEPELLFLSFREVRSIRRSQTPRALRASTTRQVRQPTPPGTVRNPKSCHWLSVGHRGVLVRNAGVLHAWAAGPRSVSDRQRGDDEAVSSRRK
ncbi:hypothetical protein SKAU_G00007030 [Synaphobranchus kaupii]|uniref:Uncharacterized protein n=1 Tax=Synaphobranchus kaupii TaxID=118154 RepID=A0A9Q1G999_SYNKA|nr:hypothetical protein SKAU_G00007030 [Synaphobranchus kaupii]